MGGSATRQTVRIAMVLAVIVATLVVPSGGLAVHDLGLLELDTTAPQFANTADDTPPVAGNNAPYDWESIFDSNGNQTLTSAVEPRLLLTDFSQDSAIPDGSYFASSNKDIDDVTTWECKSINNPTPKDEIANAYSALFKNAANNHVILYVAAERDDNNGNSFMGFWIFKSGVGCTPPGTFSGQHTNGDILVLSNFTGGGAHPLVEVYKWDSGALSLVTSGTFCHSAAAGDDVCGEVNATSFQTPWVPHNTAANPLNDNEFLEIGVDLTDSFNLPANSLPCFSRFQAETRSSQETTATLKDYAAGGFDTCSSSTVTTPKAGGVSVAGSSVVPGTSVTDDAVITGTSVVGTPPAPTGSVTFFLCGPQPTKAQAQCNTGGTQVGAAVNLPAGAANPKTVTSVPTAPTAPGWYCFRAEYSGDANYVNGSADSTQAECFQVVKAQPTVTTDIHNSAHSTVLAVRAGSTVHDFVTVTGQAGTPSGNVTVAWFTNATCTGQPAATSAPVALNGSGQADATAFAQGPLATGRYGFKASYVGNTVYNGRDGPCEPLLVVDAKILITPLLATNRVGDPHTFTVTLLKDIGDGNGFVAASGEHVDFTLADSNGSTHSAPTGSCTGVGVNTTALGQCTITFTSNDTGKVIAHALSTLSVGNPSVSVHVETDGLSLNSGNGIKTFVNAKISIAPTSATNRVGDPHTFTVTLMNDLGDGAGFVAAAGEHVDVTLTDTNGAIHSAPTGTCTNAGANTNASGQCTITFTSNSAGTVTGTASATLTVNGAVITVTTNGQNGNSAPAVKTFVDANIQITPATANNPVGTNHTLTGHVNVNAGGGAFANAPNGTVITFTLTGPGSFVGPSSCSTAGGTGSCSVVISSSTPGQTTIKASTDVTVGGVTLHRETGDAKPGDGASAVKLWADDTARTDILNASGGVVTTVVAGTIVHDKVYVDRVAGTPAAVPNPTGSVIFHRFATIDCTGAAVNQTVALTPGAPSTAISDDFAPAGNISYQAEYLGDANYPARTGACEPLTVTPVPAPAIAIVKNPKSQTVARGGTATFTITVTNVGNTVLTDVHVDDPLSPTCSKTKADIPALASMAPGASVTYTCTKPNVTAAFDNIATATGTPPAGPDVTASDTAPVKVKALAPKKKVVKKKKPKVVSHKKPKATG